MTTGSFDDRDDARLHVKQWLRSHAPADYTSQNLGRLARDLMMSDSDPVDHIRIARRERGYGIVKGLVEFAGEELASLQDGASVALAHAREELSNASRLLPNRVGPAITHLQTALDLLSGHVNAAAAEKASIAVSLALSMISGHTVKAAA